MPLLQDSEAIRENLLSRNLYTPDNPYEIDNPKLVDAINSIAKIVAPTKSIDITNTVIGRVVGPNTPIAQIGIEQLAKQFGQSFVERSLINIMPSISFTNLFDGNPSTKLFTKKSDYRITIDEGDNKIEDFLNRVSGRKPLAIPYTLSSSKNQYTTSVDSSTDNSTLIRNTGKGVLNFYYDSINRNIYKKSDRPFLSTSASQNFEIVPAGAEWFGRVYYPQNDYENFPTPGLASFEYGLKQTEDLQFGSNDDRPFEYGSESYKIRLGTHKKSTKETAENKAGQAKTDDFEFVYGTDGFSNENPENQIIWGDANTSVDSIDSKFGVRAGMLAYTRGLLQSRGFDKSYMNQTKTKWYDKDGNPMYNGSPLTRDNEGAQRTERQHSIVDPYDKFSKAIRFDGNNIYQAPKESVIHKHVIPKMHPVFDSEKNALDNRNMMFSLENLAFKLNSEGYVGDNFGTKVPKSEVGQHRGRIMWFPPYGITLSESAIAKYESTALIGRGEPIYSYSNSERIARLSFKLIIDYPPQIRGKNHAEISKFFAFGGKLNDDELANIDVNQLTAMNKNYDDELAKLVPKKVQETTTPPPTKDGMCKFYFPNDIPIVGTEGQFVIDNVLDDKYETGNGVDGVDGVSDNGYNKDFQDKVLSFVENELKVADPKDWALIKLIFKGSATKLNQKTSGYNLNLSARRVTSLREYVQDVFTSIYGKDFDEAGIKWEDDPKGDVESSDKGSTAVNMNEPDVKLERNASVTITYSGKVIEKDVALTPDEVEARKTIEEAKNANNQLIKDVTEFQNNGTMFRLRNKDDKTAKGYDDVTRRYLSPVFHSQTPEDFHRRLTFLQQCTRQGNATINQPTLDAGVPVSRNSVFGRPPICVLRIGDFFHTKVVIDSIDFDYADAPWDMNPEGMGMQFMIASIDITMRVIGGQSLKAPIDVIQNGNSFNYYANSTYYATDVYSTARKMETIQTGGDASRDIITWDSKSKTYNVGSNVSPDAANAFINNK
jgi:hypothetical protein